MDSPKMRMRKELMSKTCHGCRTLSNHMELITTREPNSSQLRRLLRYLKRSLDSLRRVRPIMRYQAQLSRLNLPQQDHPNLNLKKINLIQQELQQLPRPRKTQKKQRVKTQFAIQKSWRSPRMLNTVQSLATAIQRRMMFHMKISRSTTSHLPKRLSSSQILLSMSEPKASAEFLAADTYIENQYSELIIL